MSTRRSSRRAMVRAAALAVSGLLASHADQVYGQSSIQFAGGTYNQQFDTLPNAGAFPLVGNGPFDFINPPINAPGMQGWSMVKYAGNGANATFFAGTGSSPTGGVYSFGGAGQPDRSLGSVASGTTISRFGAVFVNTSGAPLNAFNLGYFGEQWRRGDAAANTLSFEYALGPADINTGPFSSAPILNFTSPVSLPPNNVALDGNLPANRVQVSGGVSGLNWLPGQTLVIRWTDVNDVGNDDGLGIDELQFSAAGGARNLTWNPGAPGGNAWSHNPGSTNWLDGPVPASFNPGDIANFTQAGVGPVNITQQVTPGSVNISNTSGTYLFSGQPIGGFGALTKTGAGAAVLQSPNQFTGGVFVNGGILGAVSDAALGNAVGAINLGGGEFQAGASVDFNRTVNLADATTSTFNTGNFNASVNTVAGAGSLVKTGSGVLTVDVGYNPSGTTAIATGTLRLAQPSGVVNLRANSGLNDWDGDLEVASPIRVNFNAGAFSGGGNIRILGSGAILSTDGAATMQTATIGNNIHFESRDRVSGSFVVTIGATAGNTITVDGVISGNSDVSFSSSTPGAGTGLVILNAANTWTGGTTLNFATGGVVRLGNDSALPFTTDLAFGTGATASGALDLAGFDPSIRSLASATTGVINGIANTGASTAELTINGSAVTTYAGTIGIPANLTNLTGANDNIALVLGQSHTGELNLTGNNTYNGGTRINGGALGVVSDANLGASSASIVLGGSSGSGTLRIKSGAFNSSRQVAVAIGGGVVDTGSFSATMTGPLDGAGELTKVGTGQLNVTSIRTNGLEITEGEIETLVAPTPASEATVSDVASFFIAGGPTAPTARLDLANNAMIIGDTPGPEVESAVGQYIGSGFSSGNWTGNGITSSQTDLVGSGHFGLGYGEVGALGLSEFLGRPVQPGDTVVRFTRYGDANVDGTVSLADFNALAANFGSTAAVWRQGDFNYDRLVNLADFNLLAGNFGLSAGADGVVDPEDWAALMSAVPEPGAVALLVFGALPLSRRRLRSGF